jgi:hypothetical protein
MKPCPFATHSFGAFGGEYKGFRASPVIPAAAVA